jgi:hypothetical protein
MQAQILTTPESEEYFFEEGCGDYSAIVFAKNN